MNTSLSGLQLLSDAVMRVEDALIMEVNANSRRSGYILISYEMDDTQEDQSVNQVRLNIGKNTIIISEYGEPLNLNDLEQGMRIDADFSSAMTRSIPPQSSAFRIVVLSDEPTTDVTIDRVVEVDPENNFLLTGNPYDFYDQMRFNISEATVIMDSNGIIIPLAAIQPGKLVNVEHAMFQTMSIPPQSPAYRIQVL